MGIFSYVFLTFWGLLIGLIAAELNWSVWTAMLVGGLFGATWRILTAHLDEK